MLLSNDEFLVQLKHLFAAQATSGSVFITQKRYTYEDGDSKQRGNADAGTSDTVMTGSDEASFSSTREYPCIIKATNGKKVRRNNPEGQGGSSSSSSTSSNPSPKIKISTLVQPSDYPSFSLAYGQLLKVTFVQTMRVKRKARTTGSGAKGKSTTIAESQKAQKKRTRVAGLPGDEKVLPKVYGPRRGAGHSARQARWNARVKAANKILASRRRREANNKSMFPDLVKPSLSASGV